MNNKQAYETLISSKLEELHVPDMQDAIWARIVLDLDNELPQNDPPPDPEPTNPFNKIKPVSLISAIVFIVCLLTLNKQHKHSSILPKDIANQRNKIDSQGKLQTILPSVGKSIKKGQGIAEGKLIDTTTKTSAKNYEIPIRADSIGLPVIGEVSERIKPVKIDSPVIKHKGVRGITNEDYKMVMVPKDIVKH